jgi:hypothetical protein
LLAKDPRDRYQSMIDVEAALDAFTTHGEGPRRTRPIPVVTADDIARRSDLIPRPAPTRDTPYPGIAVSAPVHKKPLVMYGLAGAGVLVGVLGIAIAMKSGSSPKHEEKPVAVTPAPAPLPAAAVPVALQKIAVTLEANVANARVTFRRRVNVAPATLQLAPSDIVELVEVSAPGYKTMRYWITFDRPTKLVAQLSKGSGAGEATEEQTLIALGEVQAPAREETSRPTVATVARLAEPKMTGESKMTGEPTHPTPRKIGRDAEAPVDTEGRVESEIGSEARVETAVEPAIDKTEPIASLSAQPVDLKLPEPPKADEPKAEPLTAEPPKPGSSKVEPKTEDVARFDTATVSAVVGKNRMDVMKCFADGKKSNPTMHGTVSVHMAVDASGKVKKVQVQSTLGSPLVAACVAKSVNAWKFPTRATTQLAMVSYPFTIN